MRGTQTILIAFVCVLAACLLPARGALAAGPAAAGHVPPEPVDRAVGRVPTSAEMVVVIDGLSESHGLPAARGLMDALSDLGLLDDLRPNWTALAAKLGWGEQETFDRLLGSRVILVVSDLQKRTQSPWALLSDISGETDARLKERIPIAARKAVEGTPVFALERGDYEIATFRPGPGKGEDRVTLLLGPAARSGLFDVVAGSLTHGIPDALANAPVVRELKGHASPGVLVALRIDPAAPGAHAGWDNFLVCTAIPRENAWECRLTIRDAEVRAQVRGVTPTSDAPFRGMSRGAMLAILETRLAGPAENPANPLDHLLSLGALRDGSQGILTGRQALAVWARKGPSQAGAAGPTPPAPSTGPAPLAAPPSLPSLCCSLAIETSDVEKMAVAGDRHLGEKIPSIEKVLGGPGLALPEFNGVACQAVRSVSLDLPADAPIRKLFSGDAQIAWSYPARDAPLAGVSHPGWLQVCVTGDRESEPNGCQRGGGACAAASRRMIAALLEPPAGGKTDRWVSLGQVRPSAWAPVVRVLVDGVADTFPRGAGILRVLDRIDLVDWRLAADDKDDVVGTLRIELTPGAK